jgi:hypothetical protein
MEEMYTAALPHIDCNQSICHMCSATKLTINGIHFFLQVGQPHTLCNEALKTSPQRLCENYNYVHNTFYANYKGARCINKIARLEVEAF